MARWLFNNADGIWEDVAYAGRCALRPMKRRVLPATPPVGPAKH
jgi:hypothetical protein